MRSQPSDDVESRPSDGTITSEEHKAENARNNSLERLDINRDTGTHLTDPASTIILPVKDVGRSSLQSRNATESARDKQIPRSLGRPSRSSPSATGTRNHLAKGVECPFDTLHAAWLCQLYPMLFATHLAPRRTRQSHDHPPVSVGGERS